MTDGKKPGEQSLSRDLLTLYDDYTELNACYAFFCEAVASLSSNGEDFIDETSAEGLRIFAQWMKEKSAAFKKDLQIVWQSSGSHGRH